MIDRDGLTAMGLPELMAASRALAGELASRMSDPGLLETLDRFPDGPEVDRSGEWGLYAHADAGNDMATEAADNADNSDNTGDAVPAADQGSAGVEVPVGSLPAVLAEVEELGRRVDVARTALAGHVDRVFDAHVTRREMLGVPEGKCAYRDSVEYLFGHLRIKRVEAKKRVGRAGQVMAHRSLDQTRELPPRMPVLAESVRGAQVDIASVDLVVDTLVAARKDAMLAGAAGQLVEGLVADGERVLAAQARETDPDTLRKVCAYWRQRFDALANPDGKEPTEAQANAAHGLFYHGRGAANLHKWSLLATDAQHEILKTIASAASNPRKADSGTGTGTDAGAGAGAGSADTGMDAGAGPCSWPGHLEEAEALDSRSRAQRELDGLASALTGALALTTPDAGTGDNNLPDAGGGGARPQVLVTIDYETLAGQLADADSVRHLVSSASYAGPINPQNIRQAACDAELIPVVLGGNGEVLDVGRAQRIFSRKLRRAITARDGGCAAPACSIPAPWCEAHHIEHWENGGPTSVDNGVLLCSHHHHAVHAGAWEISVREGVPWFIPARYHDPEQRPRRNHYWRHHHPNQPGDSAGTSPPDELGGAA